MLMTPPRKKSGRGRPKKDDPVARKGKAIQLWLDFPTAGAMEKFFASLEYSPTLRDFVTKAIRRELAEKGFWTPPSAN